MKPPQVEPTCPSLRRTNASRRRLAAALAGAGLAMLSVAGCAQPASYAVPEQFCGITITEDVLRPLLPAGKELRAEPVDLGGGSSRCKISVDKKLALYLQTDLAPSDTDPVEVRKRELDRYGNPAPVNVGDQGRVADSGALAAAACQRQGADRKVIVEAHIPSDPPQDVAQRRKDLTAFIGAYLPAVQKFLDCSG
ncbi:hypothetical protein [Streptomyces sp. NPDC048623]|uniref:hypothetical protein n=1 Tax=Streptomyces sp. NPDC048623 TaxID=3155761 RepID=UPI0034423AB2